MRSNELKPNMPHTAPALPDDVLDGPNERVGAVLRDGRVVEFRNVSPRPQISFAIDQEAVDMLDRMTGTWHTHPAGDCNPSVQDYLTFLSWPQLLHWIVSPKGVAGYRVDNGRLLRCE